MFEVMGRYFIHLTGALILVHLDKGILMAAPEDHTLRLLRELRGAIAALDSKVDGKVDSLDKKIDRNHEELKERIDSIRQAMLGESVLGRYATAEFEERLPPLSSESPFSSAAAERFLSPPAISSAPH
jgi:hypothetical protein